MLFNFLRKTENQEKKPSRSEVFSKIAEAKQNKRTSVHIDASISLDLCNELSLMGYSAYPTPVLGTNIYWKNS